MNNRRDFLKKSAFIAAMGMLMPHEIFPKSKTIQDPVPADFYKNGEYLLNISNIGTKAQDRKIVLSPDLSFDKADCSGPVTVVTDGLVCGGNDDAVICSSPTFPISVFLHFIKERTAILEDIEFWTNDFKQLPTLCLISCGGEIDNNDQYKKDKVFLPIYDFRANTLDNIRINDLCCEIHEHSRIYIPIKAGQTLSFKFYLHD
jgi:hypothetical protein